MPKMTAKYSEALATLRQHNSLLCIVGDIDNQEELYSLLQQHGYFWNSKARVWEFHEPEAAEPPTPLIMIRVWADAEITPKVADDLQYALDNYPRTAGWRLIKRSDAYLCRPPKQREARIYLEFLPPERKSTHA